MRFQNDVVAASHSQLYVLKTAVSMATRKIEKMHFSYLTVCKTTVIHATTELFSPKPRMIICDHKTHKNLCVRNSVTRPTVIILKLFEIL